MTTTAVAARAAAAAMASRSPSSSGISGKLRGQRPHSVPGSTGLASHQASVRAARWASTATPSSRREHGDGRGGVQGEGVVLVAQQDGAAGRQGSGGGGEVGVEAGGVGGPARGRRGERLGEELIGHGARIAMKS